MPRNSVFQNRLRKLQEKLRKKDLEAIYISDFYNSRYLSGLTLFTPQECEARLLILEGMAFLLTDGRYISQAKKLRRGFEVVEIKIGDEYEKRVKGLLKAQKIKNLGFESQSLNFNEYQKLREEASGVELIPAENFVEELRAIKDNQELRAIKMAVEITDLAFDYIKNLIKVDQTEKEIVFKLEFFIKERADDVAFSPIVASGLNTADPHHITSDRKIKKGDLLLLDFGAKVAGYCSDMTRILFVGTPEERQGEIYNIVLEAQEKAMKNIKAGIRGNQADRIARTLINKLGFREYFSHGLGHGVGLSEHELPRLSLKSKGKLLEKMVFTIEPGIYISGWGGIRIEDLVVLQKREVKVLTKSPKEITDLII